MPQFPLETGLGRVLRQFRRCHHRCFAVIMIPPAVLVASTAGTVVVSCSLAVEGAGVDLG